MSDEFMGTTSAQPAADSQPTAAATEVKAESKSEYAEFLEAITNQEGKPKYKTVPEALLGAAKAQEHIARIEAENAELRSVAKKVETLEEVLARLEAGKRVDLPTQTKVEDQEQLILSVLEKQKAAEQANANRESVLKTIQGRYGEKTQEVLASRAKDLGLSVSELGALASRSPQAVLEFFKVEQKGTPTVTGTVNTEALKPTADSKTPDNIMWGAPSKDVISFWRQIKADVNKELGL